MNVRRFTQYGWPAMRTCLTCEGDGWRRGWYTQEAFALHWAKYHQRGNYQIEEEPLQPDRL